MKMSRLPPVQLNLSNQAKIHIFDDDLPCDMDELDEFDREDHRKDQVEKYSIVMP